MMLALAGCGGSGEKGSTPYLDGISVSLADESTGDSLDHKYTVKLRDADGKPAEIDSVGLSLTMTGMDHKQEAELEPAGEGVYEVKLTMLMNANWRKVVILKKDNHVRKVAGAAIRTQLK
ncbi:FixH family protein [Paenibacillus sp. GCM10023252]|uniref:FixH family protein n=1 Tax=Paenibacillus sp. GCM10023252 TaxID=3252649 RepID=UPI003623E676